MPTIGGISYTETLDSASGAGDRKGGTLTRSRKFKVAWASKESFIAAMLGGTTVYGEDYVFTPPQAFEEGSICRANSYDFEGFGRPALGSDGFIEFSHALITIGYQPIEAEDRDEGDDETFGVWAEETSQFHVEMMPIPGCWLAWAGGDVLDNDQVCSFPVVFGDINLTRYNVAQLKRSQMAALCGKINAAEFRGWPAGQLLFGGFSYAYSIDNLGKQTAYTATVALKFRSIRWDYMFNGTAWAQVECAGGEALLDTAEFGDI